MNMPIQTTTEYRAAQKPRKPRRKVSSFQRSVRKAYLSTAVAKMDRLLADERRWKRKLTIAQNKLQVCRRRINEFAGQLAKDTLERTGV